jgi:hypothetical protein
MAVPDCVPVDSDAVSLANLLANKKIWTKIEKSL